MSSRLYYILLAFCAVVASVLVSDARCTTKTNTPDVYTDPLLWDDFVVKCVVDRVEYLDVTAEEWFSPREIPKGVETIQLIRLDLSGVEVLRGAVTQTGFGVVSRRPAHPDDELVLAQKLKPGEVVFITGLYRADKQRYIAKTIRVHESGAWTNIKGEGWREPLSESEIRSRVFKVGVENISKESDLVLCARVVRHRTVGPVASPHDEYDVVPEKVLKGSAPSTVTFSAGGGATSDESKWRMMFVELEEGSTWYLFLKREGDGYVPTAGWRGAFRLQQGQLFERVGVPSSYTPDRLERDVMSFMSD